MLKVKLSRVKVDDQKKKVLESLNYLNSFVEPKPTNKLFLDFETFFVINISKATK